MFLYNTQNEIYLLRTTSSREFPGIKLTTQYQFIGLYNFLYRPWQLPMIIELETNANTCQQQQQQQKWSD